MYSGMQWFLIGYTALMIFTTLVVGIWISLIVYEIWVPFKKG